MCEDSEWKTNKKSAQLHPIKWMKRKKIIIKELDPNLSCAFCCNRWISSTLVYIILIQCCSYCSLHCIELWCAYLSLSVGTVVCMCELCSVSFFLSFLCTQPLTCIQDQLSIRMQQAASKQQQHRMKSAVRWCEDWSAISAKYTYIRERKCD